MNFESLNIQEMNKMINSLTKFKGLAFACFLFLSLNSFGITNGIFKVRELSTKKYHPEVKDWDDWSKYKKLQNKVSDISFVDGKVIINVTDVAESYQFEVLDLNFEKTTSGNWNVYSGVAKREGITLGNVIFHFPDDQRLEDYKRGSVDNPIITMFLEFISYNGEENLQTGKPVPDLAKIAVSFKVSR